MLRDLAEAQFYHARLHHTKLTGIKAPGANFSGSKLDHCHFVRAVLAESKFFRAEIIQTEFREADLNNLTPLDALNLLNELKKQI